VWILKTSDAGGFGLFFKNPVWPDFVPDPAGTEFFKQMS